MLSVNRVLILSKSPFQVNALKEVLIEEKRRVSRCVEGLNVINDPKCN